MKSNLRSVFNNTIAKLVKPEKYRVTPELFDELA